MKVYNIHSHEQPLYQEAGRRTGMTVLFNPNATDTDGNSLRGALIECQLFPPDEFNWDNFWKAINEIRKEPCPIV